MKIFKETPKIPFIPYRRLLVAISCILVAASLLSLATKGLNYGTDFLGGVKLHYQFPKAISENELRALLEPLNLGNISVIRYGAVSENRRVIKISKTQKIEQFSEQITPVLTKTFGEEGLVLEREETVGPKVGQELRRKGVLAVLFSLFCMLIYIGFRFDFLFAPGAILALFHDVIVVLGAFSFFQLEFDLTILAAVLTIVGFSINDTIVIFDRIREHARLITPATIEEIVNQSLNETLSRTLLTSLTVFFTIVILYFFGGATLKDFSFAMLVGVISGTYSTLSIACAFYLVMYRLAPKFKFLAGRT